MSPVGCWCNSSHSSSRTAFSATGFSLTFLTRPSSIIVSRYFASRASLARAANSGAGSVRLTAGGPSSGRKPMHQLIRESRIVSRRSSVKEQHAAYEVTHSRMTRISCRSRLIMSAA